MEGCNGTGRRKLPLNEQRVERQAMQLAKTAEQPEKVGEGQILRFR